MNARQRKFAHEYVKNGFVGVLAVYAAGYQQGYDAACVTASRLLRTAKVQKMIEDTLNDSELTAERTAKEIAKVAYAPVQNIDSNAKLKGLDLASKVLGMQVQKIETSDSSQDSKSFLLRRISRLSRKSGQSEREIALEFQAELANQDDEDYSPELDKAIREVVQSLTSQEDTVTNKGLM